MGKFVSKISGPRATSSKVTQTCTMNLVVRLVDSEAWAQFIDTLPESYEFTITGQQGPYAFVEFDYTAKGANSHDIGRRLKQSGLEYVRGGADIHA